MFYFLLYTVALIPCIRCKCLVENTNFGKKKLVNRIFQPSQNGCQKQLVIIMQNLHMKICGNYEISQLSLVSWPSHWNILTYGNHFRTAAWASISSMVIYDYSVMGQFEHTPPIAMENPNHGSKLKVYVGKYTKISELDYGVIKVNVLLCSWVQAHIRGFMQVWKGMSLGSYLWTLKECSRHTSNLLFSLHRLIMYFSLGPHMSLGGKLYLQRPLSLNKW